jgi:hypothetical protein
MKKLLLLIIILLQFSFWIDAQNSQKILSQVKIGMSRNDVIKLVGKSDKSYFTPINEKKDSMIWDYYGTQTVLYISNKVTQIQNSNSTEKSKTDTTKKILQQKKSTQRAK